MTKKGNGKVHESLLTKEAEARNREKTFRNSAKDNRPTDAEKD